MEDMLVANKDINLVLSENDNMLLGAKTALDNAGMTEQIWLAAGADGQKEAYEEIMKEGSRYLGTGENNPYKIGTKAVEIAEALLSGETDASSYDAISTRQQRRWLLQRKTWRRSIIRIPCFKEAAGGAAPGRSRKLQLVVRSGGESIDGNISGSNASDR